MKKSVSWIEFLITFAIFMFILITLFSQYTTQYRNLIRDVPKLFGIQKAMTVMLLYSFYNNTIEEIQEFLKKNYETTYFYITTKPVVIFIKNAECDIYNDNSIAICYNKTNDALEIVQRSYIQTKSYLTISMLSSSNKEINANNANYTCINYSYAILGKQKEYLHCDFELIDNSSITIRNIYDILILTSFSSILPLYIGKEPIRDPFTLPPIQATYYTFVTFYILKNATMEQIIINI